MRGRHVSNFFMRQQKHDGKYSFVVTPLDDGCRIKKHESDAIYLTNEVAVMSGMKYLEAKGVVNINWHAVVSLVHK